MNTLAWQKFGNLSILYEQKVNATKGMIGNKNF